MGKEIEILSSKPSDNNLFQLKKLGKTFQLTSSLNQHNKELSQQQ
ncbi:MAG TPA: hypothetical protein PKH93_08960 [Chitinophagales bacterium]|nr:hypothetical protein [Chitinophagales bacterium]HNL07690.1 hypothetical protein [Chitinophagales bacterium]